MVFATSRGNTADQYWKILRRKNLGNTGRRYEDKKGRYKEIIL